MRDVANGRIEGRAMRQASMWYDTCPVCEGRGSLPCSTCSGTGHTRDAEQDRTDLCLLKGKSVWPLRRRTTGTADHACTTCSGKGAARCTACCGHGIRNLPVYAGVQY